MPVISDHHVVERIFVQLEVTIIIVASVASIRLIMAFNFNKIALLCLCNPNELCSSLHNQVGQKACKLSKYRVNNIWMNADHDYMCTLQD